MQENENRGFELEVCVDSVESGIAAEAGGADRLELCGSLAIGGITPSFGLFSELRKRVTLPLFVMLRPRFGDFCYTEEECRELAAEAERFAAAGADGFVLGMLKPDGSLDRERISELMKHCGVRPVTLHRCFDLCKDPFEALRIAEELGIARILTSGQANTAEEGVVALASLAQEAKSLRLMAGSGVSAEKIEALYRETGILSYHMSGKVNGESPMQFRREGVSMGLPGFSEYSRSYTSAEKVRAAREVLEYLDRERNPEDWRPSAETEREIDAAFFARLKESEALRAGYRASVAAAGTLTSGERTALRYYYALLPESDLCGYDFSPETLLSFLRPTLTLYRERAAVRELPESYFLQYVLLPRVNNEEFRPVREKLANCIAAHLAEQGEEALTGAALARAVNYACASEGSYVSSDGRTISAAGFLESGQGRCGEESVFYVNALRAVGIPARQVYAPWWAHCEDNHAWVEYWVDGAWHFAGACEPTEKDDNGWFIAAAARAMLVHARYYPLTPQADTALDRATLAGEEILGGQNGVLYLNQLARYADPVKLSIQADDAELVELCLLNSAGIRPISVYKPEAGVEKTVSLGKGSVYVRFRHPGKNKAVMADLRAGDLRVAERDCKEEAEEQEFRFFAPNGARSAPKQTAEEQALGREKYARCNEKLKAKRAARRDRTRAFLERATSQEERMYRNAFVASLSEKDRIDVREELLEPEFQAAMRQVGTLTARAFLEGVLPERFGLEPLCRFRGEEELSIGERKVLTARLASADCSDAEILSALRRLRGSGIPVKLRNEDGAPLFFADGDFRPFRAADAARNHLTLKKPEGELRYEQHWTLYRDGKELDLEKKQWEENTLTLLLPDGKYELFTEKRLPNGNAYGKRVAFCLAGGEEKALALSFPEVTAEELLGKIVIPEIGGQDYETPFTMEFFMAPGEEPSEHIANEILAETESLKALCAQKKLSLRFYLREAAAAERGSCKELKSLFPEAFSCPADYDAQEEVLARKLFLEPGQLPLSILRRGRDCAIFSAAGYRVGLIALMSELLTVSEASAPSL